MSNLTYHNLMPSDAIHFSSLDPEIVERVIQRAMEIQQIPAPPFDEGRRSTYLFEQFQAEGLDGVTVDELGNVYARLPGTANERPSVVSAHLDTVFPLETDLSVRREADRLYGPGIGDNSLGLAGLFGLLWGLRQFNITLPGDLWLVANVGEEGLGDLRGMRAVVHRFGDLPRAYIVLEGMSVGQVYHRALGVLRYRITVRTQGGHSWVDYGRPSAIHELAALIVRLTALPLPVQPRTTLNVGLITGGTGINVIASQAQLDLDLRSEDLGILHELDQHVQNYSQAANQPNIQVSCEVIGRRPAGYIPADHPLVRLAEYSIASQDLQPHLSIGSTDANIPLSKGLPAITLGLSTGSGAHTLQEYINLAPVQQGIAQLITVVKSIFRDRL